jgi:hypothetical protein
LHPYPRPLPPLRENPEVWQIAMKMRQGNVREEEEDRRKKRIEGKKESSKGNTMSRVARPVSFQAVSVAIWCDMLWHYVIWYAVTLCDVI